MLHVAKSAGNIVASLAILGMAVSIARAQSMAATPSAPPAPPAPPSATIPTPGVPQYTPMPMVEMNAPFGAAPTAGGSAGTTGSSVLVIPSLQSTSAPTTQPRAVTMLPAGTPLLLKLQRTLRLRTARVGDPVYLRTEFPVAAGRHVAIPAGSYVQGTLIVVRPSFANIRLTQLILPSGAVLPLANAPSAACTLLLRSASGVLSHGRHIDTFLPHELAIPSPHRQQPVSTATPTIPVPILVQPPAFMTNFSATTGAAASTPVIKK